MRVPLLSLVATAGFTLSLFAVGDAIDWDRARSLYQKSQRHETLTPSEQSYLERAKAAHAAVGQGPGRQANPKPNIPAKAETGLVPLTDLRSSYHGQNGGLYGQGRNEPSPELARAARAETARIVPLDADGKPASNGKIVLLSIGMSNTTMEFSTFVQLANADSAKSSKLEIVDGAQGGQSADRIATEWAPFWGVIEQRLRSAGVTPAQVQVVWLKEAIPGPLAGFPAEMKKLQHYLVDDLTIARKRYPNLRIAYLSSRIYAGYARSALNPEPYAYESALAVRWMIQDQAKGNLDLNFDSMKGAVTAPLLLWGPYLWADGIKGRKTDALVWKSEDFGPDGTHPGPSGRQKVAAQLLQFFKTDANTRTWFIGK